MTLQVPVHHDAVKVHDTWHDVDARASSSKQRSTLSSITDWQRSSFPAKTCALRQTGDGGLTNLNMPPTEAVWFPLTESSANSGSRVINRRHRTTVGDGKDDLPCVDAQMWLHHLTHPVVSPTHNASL